MIKTSTRAARRRIWKKAKKFHRLSQTTTRNLQRYILPTHLQRLIHWPDMNKELTADG